MPVESVSARSGIIYATCTFFMALLSMLSGIIRTVIGLGSGSKYADELSELRSIRDGGIRNSKRIVTLWNEKISRHLSELGHEKWPILEQVFIAALDVADGDLAVSCLDQMRTKFPKSSRVNRLFGMYLERNSQFDAAQAIYEELITEDATNMLARKRLIAILKAQRKSVEAIEELRKYLEIFMSDFEAWSELADLYLNECDYKHAAFCLEELLLFSPHNHLYCQRYAEIKFTEGGSENLELARAYFGQACHLCPNNLRNLYGLLLTCSALDSGSGTREKGDHGSSSDMKMMIQNSTSPLSNASSTYCVPSSQNSSTVKMRGDTQSFDRVISVLSTANASERNRLLIEWAMKQINRIYQSSPATRFDAKKEPVGKIRARILPAPKL